MSLVLLKGVSKSFGDQRVLENVSLNISEGEFTVLVGPNGAGKSTLLRIMVGLLLPDEGEVNILGFDVKKHWKKLARYIGVVLANERSLYWKLTAWENLDIFGGIYNVPKKKRIERAEELLNFFGLYDDKDKLVEDYSTGMRKKLLLCKALIHQPKILFIDEILNGLDVNAVIQVNSFLEKSSKDGVTVVMVSHILHNLSEDAKIVLLKNGKIELISRYGDIFASKDVYNQLSELFLQSSEYAENE
ncbi:ABC transporter-like protein [Thermosipho africanus H17ap60334]|uniref:ABC transporter related n=5 Tax=Fervidobacterium TaxID=2422 RepID=A7HNG3_FERNB|nr:MULTISPECIES: ABC transporter ATP-binding protein [Bacteria]PHJ12422.1 ABC transporter ATP-binding protein [Fervidobacterium sp. SC_NGM5_O18]PHJ14011.1 ABC transporter ATP-binding protein [Fervidobacterium sp. SC_NGM5_G05]UXF01281.1 ABC transporter ATP-binding protein [Fervidobacterium riparium]ABS61446.1 ABC transporter related [Fervidobacterium nodosum Rt17-B1]AFG34804.1 ABC-type multidrug transport system, ATPase component [Fervidobacterium pennivorans DSM 9078]